MKNPSMRNAAVLFGDAYVTSWCGVCEWLWSNLNFISIPQAEKVILANLNLLIKPLFQKHRVN